MPTILAALDTTPRSGPVLRWAAREATLTGAHLGAVTACGGSEQSGPNLDATRRQSLDTCVDSVLPPAQAASTERTVLSERPFDALVKASVEADLLVMGTGRHHLPWGPHELTARMLAQASCPVAVVADQPQRNTGRIAVGVDGSPASYAAYRWAHRRAERTGADLMAVMTWPWVPEYDPAYDPSRAEAACREILDETLADAPAGNRTHIVRHGHPADVLLDISHHVDLMVVGSTGIGSSGRHLLGSVSQRVAQRAACPVVITHDTDDAAPA